ncbi:hypothetical protein E2C01_064924 [Portunus trituberculatus]|uniref:Uncharacterized protein n=1 Tax=Portunus trituberculatus TaxID=210409 RepID=A0A5B7HPQ4_PORTR|nr:hypothetical protein [Portunus trituberculatus]
MMCEDRGAATREASGVQCATVFSDGWNTSLLRSGLRDGRHASICQRVRQCCPRHSSSAPATFTLDRPGASSASLQLVHFAAAPQGRRARLRSAGPTWSFNIPIKQT